MSAPRRTKSTAGDAAAGGGPAGRPSGTGRSGTVAGLMPVRLDRLAAPWLGRAGRLMQVLVDAHHGGERVQGTVKTLGVGTPGDQAQIGQRDFGRKARTGPRGRASCASTASKPAWTQWRYHCIFCSSLRPSVPVRTGTRKVVHRVHLTRQMSWAMADDEARSAGWRTAGNAWMPSSGTRGRGQLKCSPSTSSQRTKTLRAEWEPANRGTPCFRRRPGEPARSHGAGQRAPARCGRGRRRGSEVVVQLHGRECSNVAGRAGAAQDLAPTFRHWGLTSCGWQPQDRPGRSRFMITNDPARGSGHRACHARHAWPFAALP